MSEETSATTQLSADQAAKLLALAKAMEKVDIASSEGWIDTLLGRKKKKKSKHKEDDSDSDDDDDDKKSSKKKKKKKKKLSFFGSSDQPANPPPSPNSTPATPALESSNSAAAAVAVAPTIDAESKIAPAAFPGMLAVPLDDADAPKLTIAAPSFVWDMASPSLALHGTKFQARQWAMMTRLPAYPRLNHLVLLLQHQAGYTPIMTTDTELDDHYPPFVGLELLNAVSGEPEKEITFTRVWGPATVENATHDERCTVTFFALSEHLPAEILLNRVHLAHLPEFDHVGTKNLLKSYLTFAGIKSDLMDCVYQARLKPQGDASLQWNFYFDEKSGLVGVSSWHYVTRETKRLAQWHAHYTAKRPRGEILALSSSNSSGGSNNADSTPNLASASMYWSTDPAVFLAQSSANWLQRLFGRAKNIIMPASGKTTFVLHNAQDIQKQLKDNPSQLGFTDARATKLREGLAILMQDQKPTGSRSGIIDQVIMTGSGSFINRMKESTRDSVEYTVHTTDNVTVLMLGPVNFKTTNIIEAKTGQWTKGTLTFNITDDNKDKDALREILPKECSFQISQNATLLSGTTTMLVGVAPLSDDDIKGPNHLFVLSIERQSTLSPIIIKSVGAIVVK